MRNGNDILDPHGHIRHMVDKLNESLFVSRCDEFKVSIVDIHKNIKNNLVVFANKWQQVKKITFEVK